MGSSILTGERAAAFQKADGEWIYALFERGYESNVYPHQGHWSAVALGNYAAVMRRLFSHAASCEGGMLRSKAGSFVYPIEWKRPDSQKRRFQHFVTQSAKPRHCPRLLESP